jgi:hypothetical protein
MQLFDDAGDARTQGRMEQVVELGHELPFSHEKSVEGHARRPALRIDRESRLVAFHVVESEV